MSNIRPLPAEVVHRIAAGEVIDSLAAVVRELAENAIDAGAKRLTINIWADRWRIQVADNGWGFALADLQVAATAHSTSKISSPEDLWRIQSLGFRGEALHSIARLADLEIFSRSADLGWRVCYDRDGTVMLQEEAAIAPGTVINVQNLFGDWLPRREGLTNANQQLKQIQSLVGNLALCHPQVQWQLYQGDKPWFQIHASPTARHILPQILPRARIEDLRQVSFQTPAWDGSAAEDGDLLCDNGGQIELLLGLPDRCHRHRADWIKVAVNGRLVVAPELEQTIIAGMMRTLPRDRYPVCFLHIYLPPSNIDWNRHPAKSEIYLHHMEFWQEQVRQAIDGVLRLHGPNELGVSTKVTQLLTAAEPSGRYQIPQREVMPFMGQSQDEQNSLGLKVVGQLLNTYIVAEHPTGLWLVEQHIAHERVLFEEIVAAWQLQTLETPLLLTDLGEKQVERLQQIGLEVDVFGAGTWAVRRVPVPLLERPDLEAAILELSQGTDLLAAQVSIACRCAIRNGTVLNLREMQDLLDRWQHTRNPRTCPHGRPIYLSFPESALSRSFRRHWVVGKSHGI
jgi:DNA mismatch repair protein MutL